MKHLFALIISMGLISTTCHSYMPTVYADGGNTNKQIFHTQPSTETIHKSSQADDGSCDCSLSTKNPTSDKSVEWNKVQIKEGYVSNTLISNNHVSEPETRNLTLKPPGVLFSIRHSSELRTVQQNT